MRIIITGAAGGLGRALATEAVARGHEVGSLDLSFSEPELTATDHGWQRRFDVGDAADWEVLSAELSARHWASDILINNAGIGVYGAIAEIDPKDWQRQLDVCLTGPWFSLKYLPVPIVLNIGSRRGLKAVAERSAYCAAKFGLRGMTLAAAAELTTKVSIVELDSMLTDFNHALADKQKRQAAGELFLEPTVVAAEILDRLTGTKPLPTDWKIVATLEGCTVSEVQDELWP